ncbi:MAG: topoisomerase DNA-binding C4 zinc finger domain-containing protein, partial [Chthoniobacterales bacterium]
VSLVHALFAQVVPVLVLVGVAGLFLGGLLRWFEADSPRVSLSLGIWRRRPASSMEARHRHHESVPDCPMCNVPMVKRVARYGPRARTRFWGCANFPMCRCTKGDRGRDRG